MKYDIKIQKKIRRTPQTPPGGRKQGNLREILTFWGLSKRCRSAPEKKVKRVTFKAHWRLNLGLTPEQLGSRKAESVYLIIQQVKMQNFFKRGVLRGPFY